MEIISADASWQLALFYFIFLKKLCSDKLSKESIVTPLYSGSSDSKLGKCTLGDKKKEADPIYLGTCTFFLNLVTPPAVLQLYLPELSGSTAENKAHWEFWE